MTDCLAIAVAFRPVWEYFTHRGTHNYRSRAAKVRPKNKNLLNSNNENALELIFTRMVQKTKIKWLLLQYLIKSYFLLDFQMKPLYFQLKQRLLNLLLSIKRYLNNYRHFTNFQIHFAVFRLLMKIVTSWIYGTVIIIFPIKVN